MEIITLNRVVDPFFCGKLLGITATFSAKVEHSIQNKLILTLIYILN